MFDVTLFKVPGALLCTLGCSALALLCGILIVVQATALGGAIVSVWEGSPLGSVLGLLGGFVASFILQRAAMEAQTRLGCFFADRLERDLTDQLIDALYENGPLLLSRLGRPAAASLLAQGMDEVRDYTAMVIRKTVNMLVIPLVLVVAIFALDWLSGIIALVCYPFIVLFMMLIGRGAKEEATRTHGGFLRMANHYMDSVRGLRTLKSFGRGESQAERVYAASEAYRKLSMGTLRIGTLSSTVLDIFATCGLAAVAIMLGFRLVEGTVTFLPAIIVLMLVPEYFTPVKAFAKDYHASLKGKASLALIERTIGEAHGAEERTRELIGEEAPDIEEGGSLMPFRELAFRDVSFTYPDATEPALRHGSFTVRDGEVLGVLGRSGAGKSTLLDIIAGLENPSDGEIQVDGRSLRTLQRTPWRDGICYIPQAPLILTASLRHNLTMYVPDASDEELWGALEALGLKGLFEGQPLGLDTPLGEGGLALSGGEAQRVCVARALLDGKRAVWVLDEPTARLDGETESALIEAILGAAADKTVIVATHSNAWLPFLDRSIHVEEGSVHA